MSEAQELELQVVVSLLLRMLCEQSATPLQEQYTAPPHSGGGAGSSSFIFSAVK